MNPPIGQLQSVELLTVNQSEKPLYGMIAILYSFIAAAYPRTCARGPDFDLPRQEAVWRQNLVLSRFQLSYFIS